MRASLFLISLLLSSAACSGGSDVAEKPETKPTAEASREAAQAAAKPKGEARKVKESTKTYEFEFSYPAEAAAYPRLKAYLDDRIDSQRASVAKDAQAFAEEEVSGDYERPTYASSNTIAVIADLPGWLSLSDDFYSYTGGAHGNYGKDALVYDKDDEEIRQSQDLFVSRRALWSAVETRFCAALDKEREKRRGEPVDRTDEYFGGCPGLDEVVVMLGSSNKRTFDRMALYAGPYVAGSYAEGGYEINLPIDAQVLAAVRPEYRKAFSASR